MKGLIFIPDINGFTNFVQTVPSGLGAEIINDLLNVIIDSNELDMELSEIEGDAILFYSLGNPVPFNRLMNGAAKILEAFMRRFEWYKHQYNLEVDLSLKFIVHYGDILVYDIKGFKKLYGETVIESHRLLKTGNLTTDYVLVTEDYMEALKISNAEHTISEKTSLFSKSQLIGGLKKIAYYLFHGANRKLILETAN